VRFGPSPALGGLELLLGIGALLGAVAGLLGSGGGSSTAPGLVLLVVAGLLLVGVGLRDLLLTPVLAADSAGVQVRATLTRDTTTWQQVDGLRVVRDRRVPLLELDLAGQLVVLSRRRLGRHPDEVLTALEQVRRG
jgi:hypothetical protein